MTVEHTAHYSHRILGSQGDTNLEASPLLGSLHSAEGAGELPEVKSGGQSSAAVSSSAATVTDLARHAHWRHTHTIGITNGFLIGIKPCSTR